MNLELFQNYRRLIKQWASNKGAHNFYLIGDIAHAERDLLASGYTDEQLTHARYAIFREVHRA